MTLTPRILGKRCVCWLVFTGSVAVILLAQAPFGWAQERSQVVVTGGRHAVAPPLSQVAPIAPRSPEVSSLSEEEEGEKRLPRAPHAAISANSVLQLTPNTTLPTSFAALASTSLSTNSGLNILGVGVGFSGYSTQASVADTNGAAGTTQYFQIVNDSFAVFNKSNGTVAYGPASGNTLWQAMGAPCANNPNLDETVQFDQIANRWVVLMPVGGAPPYLCVAVSQTADAVNGGWNLYYFLPPTSKLCGCRLGADYAKLTVWPDAYYITYNGSLGGNYEGPYACAINRSAVLSGSSATMQCFTNVGSSYGSLLAADLDGSTLPPSGSPEYLMDFNGNDQSLDVWQFHVDWNTPSNSTFTGPTNIPVAAFTEPCGETVVEITYQTGGCVPQLGTSTGLDSYGDRLMYRLAYRNLGSHQSLVANHTVQTGTNGNQTGIRWYELQNTGSGFSLYQQGTYAPDSSYRWMGSIAMDKAGDIAVGYNTSSSTINPTIRYTGRVPTDALGTMEGEVDVLSSANVNHGSQTNSFHWADYASMSIDPSDDCTFWFTTQYIPTTGAHWSTRIANFSFPNCSSTGYTLTANEVGQGTVTSSDGSIDCVNETGTCSASYASGTSVTLTATPASGWTFSGWTGVCTGANPCNITMTSNWAPTATFASSVQTYTLTANEVGQGTVTSSDGAINCVNGSGSCSASYASGASVTLTATPAAGWTFSGWSGICNGANPCNVTMTSNWGPTATFAAATQTYKLTANENGQGTVTSTDGLINCKNGSGSCSASYPSGSVVTMNAAPASGWTFSNWTGVCNGANPCKVTMTQNWAPWANFAASSSAWTVVNKASKSGSPLTSLTIPSTGSGNVIAVALLFNGTTSVTSISDNVGNTYISAGARSTNGAQATEIWYALNSISGATVITPKFAGSPNHVEMTSWEVSGLANVAPDATAVSKGTVTLNNTPGPAVTTTQTGDFIISVLFANTASFTAISSGNEFTDDFTTFGNGWAHITSSSAAAGTHQASWYTSAPAGSYCASTVAFLP